MLTVFLFQHKWRCTYDWKIRKVQEQTLWQLTAQKNLKDEYEDPNTLPKIGKANMPGIIKFTEENLRLHCGVMKAPLV